MTWSAAGKAGLGFIETPHLPSDLVTEHVRDDELLVVTAPGHPWARRRRPLSLAQIAAVPLVMREAGSGTRDTLTDHLAAQHPPLRPTIAMELGTSAAVGSAIAAGVGPGVLSRLAVRDDLVLGRLVAVELAGPPADQAADRRLEGQRPAAARGQRLLAVARGPRVNGGSTRPRMNRGKQVERGGGGEARGSRWSGRVEVKPRYVH